MKASWVFVCMLAVFGADAQDEQTADSPEEPQIDLGTQAWDRLQKGDAEDLRLGLDSAKITIGPNLRDALKDLTLEQDRFRGLPSAPESVIALSLETSLLLALQLNTDIHIAQWDPERFEGNILIQRGVFDPVFFGDASFAHVESSRDTNARVGGLFPEDRANIEEEIKEGRLGFRGKLHVGTQYELSFDILGNDTKINYPYPQRLPSFARQFLLGTLSSRSSNLSFSLLSALTRQETDLREKEWSTGINLTLTQPLLRGMGKRSNLARLRIAENDKENVVNRLHLVAMRTVAAVATSYWDLYESSQLQRLREKALERGDEIMSASEDAYEAGVVPAIDVIQSRAGISERQDDLIASQRERRDAEDVLKDLLDYRKNSLFERALFQPTTGPGSVDVEVDEERSVALGLARRPEMMSAILAIESAEYEIDWSTNNKMPQLDFVGAIGIGSTDDSFGDAFSGTFEGDDLHYFVGVRGSVPIRNLDAKGRLLRARATAHQTEDRRLRVEQIIGLEVRTSIRAVETSQLQVESSGQTSVFREASLVAERDRLRLGQTTSFHVLEVEEDGTDAQILQLHSRISLERALISLWLAEGTILEQFGIEFESLYQNDD